MTGDGMIDCPTLALAYVVLVMGLAGADMAKEAADIIFTEDMFASLVRVMGEGRILFDNI
jgi:Ca2+-transporting ATPase